LNKWEQNVKEEIRTWSAQVLEKTSVHFGNMPPCPFAKKAWLENKVEIKFGNKETVKQVCRTWNGEYSLIIVVTVDWPWEEINDWCDEENDTLSNADLTLMPFVPTDEGGTGQPDDEAEDWEHLIDEPYGMVFIQELSEVNAASVLLEQTKYYENCPADFLKYVKDRRMREKQ
tara:strand:+ start:785 stop:1303 length:519 start_codon:yes stop_codon:yes gene_type:complete